MKDLNQVILEGRLTKDSEVRKTVKGKTVQTFSIAVNDDYKPKDSNEWVNRAYFHNCVYFGELDGLNKGVHILITGKLTTSKSETENGTRIYTNVEVQSLKFIKDKEKVEKTEEVEEDFVKGKADDTDSNSVPF
jgi:single-strand DNA-binding protein